ncbi:hypothetical protein M513_04536, partial [Trichuris suis]
MKVLELKHLKSVVVMALIVSARGVDKVFNARNLSTNITEEIKVGQCSNSLCNNRGTCTIEEPFKLIICQCHWFYSGPQCENGTLSKRRTYYFHMIVDFSQFGRCHSSSSNSRATPHIFVDYASLHLLLSQQKKEKNDKRYLLQFFHIVQHSEFCTN